MRSRLVAHPSHRAAMAIVFVAVLVVSFFALAPTALACHSHLLFEKTEYGAAAPNDVYTIIVTDQNGRSQHVEIAVGAPSSLEVPPGTYSFVEMDAPAGATIDPESVVVGVEDDQQTIRVRVTNPYPAGKLAITKVETGANAPGGTYTFDVTGPVSFDTTVAAFDTWTSDWLPLGTYTVTERNAPDGHTIDPNPAVLTEDGETITVTATNPYPEHGKLAITKVETGANAPGGTYTFDVTGPVSFDTTVAAFDTWTSDWLPLGTYTVTERNAPDGHTIDPNPAVLTEDGETITVTATNPYPEHGKLAITKVETGANAPGGTYTFDVTGPVSFDTTVAAFDTWTSDWLPLGTYTVTERNAPDGHTIDPNPAVLTEDGETITVTATNPYPGAYLTIRKVVTGPETPDHTFTIDVTGPESFTVTLAAGTTWVSGWLPLGTYDLVERDAPAGATIVPNPAVLDNDSEIVSVVVTNPYAEHGKLAITKVETGANAPGGTYTFDVTGPVSFDTTVAAFDTWTSDWLPLGTYTVTERNAPDGHTIDPNPAVLTEDGETITVTATNPYPGAYLTIRKVVTGPETPDHTFTIDVTGPESFTVTLAAGTTWVSGWLPLGTYDLVERDAPAGATIVPNPAVLDNDSEIVSVVVTNPWPAGKLAITKVVTGPEMPDHTFTINVTGPESFTVVVAAGETWTSNWLPLGTYTFAEVDPWDDTTIVPNPAVLDDEGETVTVVVTNPWPAGRLAINKVETGPNPPGGTYVMNVTGPETFSVSVKAGTTWTSGWLPLGTYTIEEVGASDRTTIVPNPVVLEVDGATVTATVTNPVLPPTGQGFGILPSVAATLVAFGATALLVVHGPRRRA